MTKRSLTILILAVAAAAMLLAGSYQLATRLCTKHLTNAADDLDWLRQEFRLSDAEMLRVRTLHDGYLPKCREMCRLITAKKHELEAALSGATNVSTMAEGTLTELGALRAQCQAHMLRHFAEVGQAMPAEQGRRYLAEMQRLTLGFHEQIEQSMAHPAEHEHGNH